MEAAPMSTTLNLLDVLLARGRNFASHGNGTEATRILERLASFRSLPPALAEETQSELADLAFARRDYKNARRHLSAALARSPENADYHYRMAVAIEEDAEVDDRRAGVYYRRALALEPANP